MELNRKQKMIELLSTMIEGTEYINNNIGTDYSFMIDILLDAINSVKKSLDKSKKCDHRLLKLTEEIKNNILLICTESDFNILEEIVDNVSKMIDIIKSNSKRKLNVVFMPYNATMWNSLESIWKQSKNDENCICHVVPIPYYKLIENIDGKTECVFNYEGDKLPEYVPITKYKDFNLEKIKPDIIYIHNQYDDCNNATRVDSNYFSYNLKKHTDMLVYVTYGILGTYPIGFYNNFYSFIATRNFDKVIVQSPAFEYIAEFNGVDKNKILALGSPKFDAVVESLNNRNINQKFDYKLKNKTVFLWTTNLMKIINGRHKVLDEIESLFNLIENSSEYGLIYRPHPLELEYVKSKAPECFERYNQMLKSIESKHSIVLDNTSSYYDAFNLSDALITDRSSVLIEYIKTGKPVLIYDIDMKKEYYNPIVFDIFANYIVGEDGMNIEKFINLVRSKKDIRRDERLNALKNVIVNADGSCGEKIHNAILNEVTDSYF